MIDSRVDCIHIRDLLCRCIVGINDDERTKPQEVIINVTMETDLRPACASDRIEDTIDYKAVKQRILALVEESSYFLIERLAGAVADICLDDSRVKSVRVCVDKPGALRFARSVAVEIVRKQIDEKREV